MNEYAVKDDSEPEDLDFEVHDSDSKDKRAMDEMNVQVSFAYL